MTSPVLSDSAATYTPGVSERRSSTTKYLHAGLKNADLQTNSSQTNTGTRRYDAFGLVVGGIGTYVGSFGYAGKFGYQSSEDAELMLLGHRYYDPYTGRFLTRDPIRDGRNWYGYCGGNPNGSIDPSGLLSLERVWGRVSKVWGDLSEWWSGKDRIGPVGEPIRIGGWPALFNEDGNAMSINGTVHLNDFDDYESYMDDGTEQWRDHEHYHLYVQEPRLRYTFVFGVETLFQYFVAGGHDGAPIEIEAMEHAGEISSDEAARRYRAYEERLRQMW